MQRIKHIKTERYKYISRDIKTEFTIVGSITKDHFKQLMMISRLYDKKSKCGGIADKNINEFLEIVSKAEKSSDKACVKSHEKSIEKSKNRSNSKTFECPDCAEIVLSGHTCWESGLSY